MAFVAKHCLWILPLLNLLVSPLWADEIPLADCEALVAKYGKLEVASVAHSGSDGIITVEVNGHLIEKVGGQDPEFITPRSICADLEKSGIALERVPDLIHERPRSRVEEKLRGSGEGTKMPNNSKRKKEALLLPPLSTARAFP